MLNCLKSRVLVDATNKLGIMKHILPHLEVFATDRAIGYWSVRESVDCTRCTGWDSTIDDCERRTLLLDVFHSCTHETFTEWIADVKHFAYTVSCKRFDIDPDGRMLLLQEF